MEETLKVLNRMESEEVIGRYAIGGAVAASYYAEPSVTYDLDVFTVIGGQGLLIDLSGVYDWLRRAGYSPQGGGVVIEGWEVQFLVPGNPLVDEALKDAEEVVFGKTPTRVFTAEHLALIMLELGRSKDKVRLAQFVEEEVLDSARMIGLADRFDLGSQWRRFKETFFDSE